MKTALSIILITFSYLSFAQSASEICPLNIGSEVPSAIITSLDNKKVDVKSITSSQPTVIVFYRGGWCPYCTKHLSELREIQQEISDLGYQVIALSTDDIKELPVTLKEQKLTYKLFSDRKYNAMNAFGISFKPKQKRLPVYARVMKMTEREVLVPVPAVFVIKEGVIKYKYVNPTYSTRLSSEMLLSALKSIK